MSVSDKLPAGSRILYRILTEKSTIDFGKYDGLKIGDVITIDPSYIAYMYYNLSNISFKKEILEDMHITSIPKPGKDEEAWKRWQNEEYHRQTDNLDKIGKIKRKMHIQKNLRLDTMREQINQKNARKLTKSELQRINHGHISTDAYGKFIHTKNKK